jgi:hypothetical protein
MRESYLYSPHSTYLIHALLSMLRSNFLHVSLTLLLLWMTASC